MARRFTAPKSKYNTGQASKEAISRPFNVHHETHVDAKLEWTGQNLEEVFEQEELLGEGAFGQVWRARHKTAGFEVAIKARCRLLLCDGNSCVGTDDSCQ